MAETTRISRENINEGSIVVGVVMMAFFLTGLTLQTATTEAYGHVVQDTTVLNLLLGTLAQLPGILTGTIHLSQLPSIVFGWMVEIMYYACITGHKKMKKSVEHHHPWAILALDVIAMGCVAFCAYTDWLFAVQLVPGFWGPIFFSILISAMVSYCGASGWHYIKSGFGRA